MRNENLSFKTFKITVLTHSTKDSLVDLGPFHVTQSLELLKVFLALGLKLLDVVEVLVCELVAWSLSRSLT